MAAGQQKKRLNAANVLKFNWHEHDRLKKKKKLDSPDYALNMASRIFLEWDDSRNRVAAQSGQVGITWRDMVPFLDSVPQSQSGLADVFSVPREILELENMSEVLSCEVWETYLSESERILLIQLLPRGIDVDQAVESLLTGENIHFGNPLCKWGASLCAGNLHPDAVLRREQHLRVDRNNYFLYLRKYHIEIIESLSTLKERWTSCKNPEKEIVEKMWRKGIVKPMQGSSSVTSEKVNLVPNSKREQPRKICLPDGDAAKYMSCFKITRKQRLLVKSIKHSGDGIQSKSLNHVLGDIRGFHIQPYEVFEEEERKQLHKHWLQLASKDLPAAFEDHKERSLLRNQWRKSVDQELKERRKLTEDEENTNLSCSSIEQVDDGESEQQSALEMQDEVHVQPARHCMDGPHLERIPSLNSHQEFSPVALDQGGSPDVLEPADPSPIPSEFVGCENAAVNIIESKHSPDSDSPKLERFPSLNSHQQLSTMDEEGNQDILKSDTSLAVSQFPRNLPTAEAILEPKVSISSSKDIWCTVGIEDSCYHPASESQGCTSAGELSLRQPQPIEEQSPQLIDVETQMLDREAAESVASALPMGNRATMFDLYLKQDHNLLLPPFHKGEVMLPSYPQEHWNGLKQSEVQFLVAKDGSTQSSQFPHILQEQQGLLKQRQAGGEEELYMQQTMGKSVYSNGRFPTHGYLSSVDTQDWTNFQSPANGGLLGHNWFPGEHCTRDGWSGVEPSGTPVQCLGDGGNADGSLFSLFSECKKLPSSHSPYVTARSEQFASAGNSVGGRNFHSDGIFTYTPHLNSSSSRDIATSKMSNMPRMNFPHPNPGLPDSVGKSFLRSWNR